MRRFLVSIVVSSVLAVSLGVLLNAEGTSTLISANHHFPLRTDQASGQEDSLSRSVESATEFVYQGVNVSTVSRGSSSPVRHSQQNSDDLAMTPPSWQLTVGSTPTVKVFFTRPYAMTSIAVFDAL